uniref:VWFA domain-containing protein n=1 Tax=Panagrolaimus davidi TaxID=227884 RepID=A0A914PNT6_9BILA
MPTSPTPSPTATVPPPTCNNDIAILIDQSVAVGNVTDFNKQINFLTNTLVNTWNVSPENIETLGLLYSQFGTYLLPTKPFGYNTTQQFVSDLNSVKGRDPMGYNDITAGLTSLQSHLTNLRPGRDLTTILITYNDDFFDVMSAIPVAEKISGKLIIVAVNTLAGNLYYLSGTVIQTDKDFNWDVAVQINTAICQSVIPPSPLPTSLPSPSPTTSPTTSTAATPSTPPPVDYIPCKSSIVFALDASNNNGDVEFAAMKRLVTNNIVAQNWTHFERVGLMSYADSSSCTYVYGTFGSKQNFDNTVNNNITKFASSNSITFGMGILMNTFVDLPLNYQNTIFFTSTSDPTDVAQAATNSVIIDYRGALIIVAIYPAKKQDLLPLVAGDASKIIEFNPLTNIDYDTYAAQILSKFDCGATTSTSPTPSTSISPTSSVTGPTRHGVSIYTLQTITPQATTTTTGPPSTTATGPISSTVTTTTGPTSPTTTVTGQPPSTSTPAVPYIPCQSWIYFGVDDSNVLQDNQFMTQLNFISSAIGNITHPERIAANGMYSTPVPWNSGLTVSQIQSAVTQMFKGGPYSLGNQFSAILTNVQNTPLNSFSVGALIFISDTSTAALQGADQHFNQLTNVRITFVLLGTNVDASKLAKYSNNTISWPDLSQSQPTNWNNLYGPAYACTGGVSTLGTTTTTVTPPTSSSTSPTSISSSSVQPITSPTSTTQTSPASPQTTTTGTTPTVPYIPCQSWISFNVDDSHKLDPTSFAKQISFISSAIGNITHPERIAALSIYNDGVSWNNPLTISEIQNTVQSMQQLGDYRLRRQFAAIATALSDISNSNTQPIGSLIFISDTSVAALDGAEYYMDKMPNVKITFVLLGPDADQTKLTNFSSNFITWKDLSQPQPDNWNNLYGSAYGCSGPLSTIGPTSTTVTPPLSSSTVIPTSTSVSSPSSPQTSTTQPTSVTSPTSSTSGQTSPTSPQTTTTGTTPAVPFIPCQSWISFNVDDSNKLDPNSFTKQLNFISSAIGNITHPERIAAIGGYFQPVSWNSGLTIPQIQTAVNGMQQGGPYSLRMQFAALLTTLQATSLNNIPVGALIFISDTSTAALQGADQLFNQLTNVRITFVLLGNSADSSKLTQFSSNFITWSDLSQPQPTNWNNLYGPAYACLGGISSLSPTSTGTTITPFSSTITSTIISSSASSPSSTIPSSSTIFSTQSTGPTSTPATVPSTSTSLSSTITSTTTSTITSTGAPTSPTSPSDYIPCHSWISFNIDDSNTLSTDNYNKQLNFISAVIGDINHPERIQAIGAYDQPVFWNSPFSIADIQTAVKALPQEGAYRLRQQFAELLTGLESIQTNNAPVGALIFISDTSDAALQDASAVFSLIQNVRITFVLLGPNTDQNKLTNFSSNFINWKDLSQPLPDNWSNLYGTAYGCSEGISTVSPISTVTTVLPSSSSVTSPSQTVSSSSSVTTASQAPITSTTGSTPSAGDYVPCQVLITTLVDISNALSIDQFQKQLTFTKNFMTQINHPERIQYGAYYEGNGNMTFKWNDTNTQAGLLQAIDDTKQTSLPTSLAGAMRVLSNNAPQNRTIQDSTIIFVTDTTNSIQIQQAVNLYNSLLKARGVRLTFILAGNKTDATALSGFNDTIIFNWQNMNISQPVGWDLSAVLRCKMKNFS